MEGKVTSNTLRKERKKKKKAGGGRTNKQKITKMARQYCEKLLEALLEHIQMVPKNLKQNPILFQGLFLPA